MSNMRFVPKDLRDLHEVHEWRNAIAVLSAAYPQVWDNQADETYAPTWKTFSYNSSVAAE